MDQNTVQQLVSTGRNKNICINEKHNTALKTQTYMTSYVGCVDLVHLGDESWSGAGCLTPRGAL